MSKRVKYSKEEKYGILKEVEFRKSSIEKTCEQFKIDPKTFREWRYKYNKYGIDGLDAISKHKYYTDELKIKAILEYLNEEGSLIDISRKYEISSKSVLSNWIKRYNSHNQLNTMKGRNDAVMTKGRKTNLEEKIEIVKYCIDQNKDYQKTCEVYQVSYTQVYQWVKKYEELGESGLVDRRGKTKIELSKEDKDNIEMRKLKKDNERLKMENDFLKKLQELERRGF